MQSKLLSVLCLGSLFSLHPGASASGVTLGSDGETPGGRAPDEDEIQAGGPEPVDEFHPGKDEAVTPAYGGRAILHLPALPQNLCYAIENSAYTRWMLYELNETLVQRDWETWEWNPVLAERYESEDTLVLSGGRSEENGNILYGKVTERGEEYVITPVSKGSALTEERTVPKADVERLERGTVWTFYVRDGVKWHDGHPFDAYDVLYSYQVYGNPHVDCDSIRVYFKDLVHAEVIDERTIRFFYNEQYFRALDVIGDMFILPSHLYNLRDPDHARHDANATDEALGKEINENEHNTAWVGTGPYRLTVWSQEYVEAVRFDDYFDPSNAGYFDTLRWRHIPNDDLAFQALINGELDFTYRIQGDDYFGEATQKPEFADDYYKGYYYVGSFNYTPWNTRKPYFSDVRVRKALAHSFDFDEYLKTFAHGLAKLPTGPQAYFSPAYNHDVQRLEYDLDKAEELLAEAGWYDRDGDGIIDKDGIPFEFEFMITPGNKVGQTFSQKMQENLDKLGIKLTITAMEWATYLETIYERDFDAAGLAWSLPVPESDPIQLWHSSGAPKGVRGSNHPGVADEYVDKLIAEGRRELDDQKRWAMWRELHRYLYDEVQPYLYRLAPPRKFGMNKKIRGFQSFKINPGYSARRWYFPAGTPGTRSTLEKS